MHHSLAKASYSGCSQTTALAWVVCLPSRRANAAAPAWCARPGFPREAVSKLETTTISLLGPGRRRSRTGLPYASSLSLSLSAGWTSVSAAHRASPLEAHAWDVIFPALEKSFFAGPVRTSGGCAAAAASRVRRVVIAENSLHRECKRQSKGP